MVRRRAADRLVRSPLRTRDDRRRLRELRLPDQRPAGASNEKRANAEDPAAGSVLDGVGAADPVRTAHPHAATRTVWAVVLGEAGLPPAPAAGERSRPEEHVAAPAPMQPDEVEPLGTHKRAGLQAARSKRGSERGTWDPEHYGGGCDECPHRSPRVADTLGGRKPPC